MDKMHPLTVGQQAMWQRLRHYDSQVCTLCRQAKSPWKDDTTCWVACDLCVAGFHDSCYWHLAATTAERNAWEVLGSFDGFICPSCRS